MVTVNVQKADFSRILNTAEALIDEVESALSQDEIARTRIAGILSVKTKGATDQEYYAHLKKRGVKVT